MPPAPTLIARTNTTCTVCGKVTAIGGEIYALASAPYLQFAREQLLLMIRGTDQDFSLAVQEDVPGYQHPECAREYCQALGRPFQPRVSSALAATEVLPLFGDECI